MDTSLKDIRFAVRNLRKHPAFSAVAIITIALGIGTNTAIFSVVNGVLLQDLPYDQPDRLVRVWSTNAERGVERGFMSPPDIADYQERQQTFVDLAAYSEAELAMIDRDGGAVKVTGTWAGDNLFSVLGVAPLLGRALIPEDGARGAATVMVLGHAFWQSRFGGDPDVIGTSITVEEASYTVVGIMPAAFDFPGNSNFWLNRYLLSYPGRYARWMDVIGRVNTGVDVEAARGDLSAIAAQLEAEYPSWNRGYGTTLMPLHESMVGETRSALLILLGATGFLLLIACVNVVNLLLSRMADRGREIALRSALGAGRMRLGRQLLTESIVLAAVGAALGTALAALGIDLLIAIGPANLPRLDEVALDGRVLLFTLGTTAVTGLAFGLAPALRLARTDIQAALQDAGKGSTGGVGRERLRGLLVTTEIALAVMLVIGAGLLVRSFSLLLDTDPGFNATGVLTFQLDLPTAGYREFPAVADYHAEITERLSNLPGVQSVAATATLPFDAEVPFLGNFAIEGRPTPREGEEPRAIGLVNGREFALADHGDAPGVAVINEALARQYFPTEDPIGEAISGLPPHLALGGFLTERFEIVGVVQDVKYFGLAQASEPSLYFPVAQAPFRQMSFTLRTTREPEALMPAVRRELAAVDLTVPISRVETMERVLSASVARERFSMLLLGLFATVALVLAAVGIYGVISYSTSQRTAELGIRMAVGADAGDVLKLVMIQGAKLAGWGVGVGLLGAVALSRVMASQLYRVSARDPLIFVGVALVLALVALVATYLPAVRAARIDPVLALQSEGR
jgi:predicted permease